DRECCFRNTATYNSATNRIRTATAQTEPGIRPVHQQESLCIFDGDGVRTGTRYASRWREERPRRHSRRAAAADLDRTRAREFARWNPGDARAGCRRGVAVAEFSVVERCSFSGFEGGAHCCTCRGSVGWYVLGWR